jgi:hypothetical protein
MRVVIRIVVVASIFAAHVTFGQLLTPPPLDWQAGFGGTGDDIATTFVPVANGGYLVAGYSDSSTNGNKTAPAYGGFDYWIVRLDESGNALWDRSYGGSTNDMLHAVVPMADGGFILGGFSQSAVSGTKTSTNFGGYDYWLVRINASGDVLWDRSFGGTGGETLWSMEQTSDGGLVLGGLSRSGPGGNKTSVSYGNDIWLVRLDAAGEILWDLTYGAGVEVWRVVVRPTPEGGFFVGGTSSSGIGGNKTSTNHTSGLGFSWDDYWVLRLDGAGNKLWERQLGGTERDALSDLTLLPGGGVLASGHSYSYPGGTKTAPNHGTRDYWIVRLDSNGNQLWDESYGGAEFDRLRSATMLSDGGLVLFGHSPGVPPSFDSGGLDYWLVRIDSQGDEIWNKQIGGSREDGDGFSFEPEGSIVVTSNSVVIGGTSRSGVSGLKMVPNFGRRDFWVVSLNDAIQPDLATSVPAFEATRPQCVAGTNTLRVWNRGTGTLFYNVSTDVPWATVSPTNGVTAGETNTHVITYANSAPIGTHLARVTFSSSSTSNVLATVPLSLTLTPPPPPTLRIARVLPSPAQRLLLGPAACPIITELSTNLVDWILFHTNAPATVEREVPQSAVTGWPRFYRARTP